MNLFFTPQLNYFPRADIFFSRGRILKYFCTQAHVFNKAFIRVLDTSRGTFIAVVVR